MVIVALKWNTHQTTLIKLMYNKIKILFLFILLLSSLCIKAQVTNDAGLWTTLSIEKEFTKKFSVSVDEEIRLKENFTQLNLLYTNLGLNYKFTKAFKVSLTYRMIEKYMPDDWLSFRHRLMLDISYKQKIKSFSLYYRSRFQSEVQQYYSTEFGKIPEWYWRHKFELKYNLNKFSPYLGTELRYQFTNPRSVENDYGWHRIRMFAGTDYKIDSRNTVGLYYLIQQEYDVKNPSNLYIVGLEYSLTLPCKQEKK